MLIEPSNFPTLHDVTAFATQYDEYVAAVFTTTVVTAVLIVEIPYFRRLVQFRGPVDVTGYAGTGVLAVALLATYQPITTTPVTPGLVLAPALFLIAVFFLGTLTYTAPYLIRARRVITRSYARIRRRIRTWRSPNRFH